MSKRYFVRCGNEELGPLNLWELKSSVATGDVRLSDFVRISAKGENKTGNGDEWDEVGNIVLNGDALFDAKRMAGPKPIHPDNQDGWWATVKECCDDCEDEDDELDLSPNEESFGADSTLRSAPELIPEHRGRQHSVEQKSKTSNATAGGNLSTNAQREIQEEKKPPPPDRAIIEAFAAEVGKLIESGGDWKASLQEGQRKHGTVWDQGARQKTPAAQWLNALCFEQGLPTIPSFVPSLSSARALLESSASGNYSPAQYRLALYERYGLGGQNADRQRARAWLEAAAHQGHRAAMCELGIILSEQADSTEERFAALEWFFKAAQLGSAEAWYRLGLVPRRTTSLGEYRKRSQSALFAELEQYTPLQCFRKAAALGHADATEKAAAMQDNLEAAQRLVDFHSKF